MRYTRIPGTDLTPSVICFGTGSLGSSVDQAGSFALLDACLDHGCNFFDSAKIYADWLPNIPRSVSEKTLGEWVKARRNRSRLILATKGAHPDLNAMTVGRCSRQEIVADLDASLKSLQVDCIDLYWLHRDELTRPVGEILETLNDQVKAGKIRAFGGSNWGIPRLEEARLYAEQHHLSAFCAVQNMWNLAVIDAAAVGDATLILVDGAQRQYHQKTGLAAVPYSSQANGLFNKMMQKIHANPGSLLQGMYRSPANLRRLEKAQALMVETGLTITQVVLGYLLSMPFPVFPIIGSHTLDQLADSLSAGDIQISPEQIKFLES
jgi:aryl-alcohol dehydrogenase-like predicted oxidoreductase